MRVLLAAGMMAASMLVTCGCSSMKMPPFPTFGAKKSRTSSELANAPAPPGSYSTSTAPNVSMPQGAAWSNLPVYPGTNYPQTPYPEQAMTTGAAPAYASQQMVAPSASPYAPSYGAMPPTVADNSATPYAPYAGGQAAPYANAQVPSYTPVNPQQPSGSYAGQTAPYAQPATPYPQQAAPYAQQQPTPYPQQQAPTYGGSTDPYGATGETYNAANPYGTYTR